MKYYAAMKSTYPHNYLDTWKVQANFDAHSVKNNIKVSTSKPIICQRANRVN